MELQLSLSLPTELDPPINGFLLKNPNRFFGQAFSDKTGSGKKWSLQVMSGMAKKEDDDPEQPWKRSSSSIGKDDEEKSKLVGWPPIKAWRKKQFHQDQHQAALMEIDRIGQNENQKYVKVQMEGVAIGRKINLSLHNSYLKLQASLITMFAKYSHYDRNLKNEGESFSLTYQDKEGNWGLAGDLPWESFVETVQRMKVLMKTMEHRV